MPGWLKGLLIVVVVIGLLVVGAIGAGYLWWVRNKDTIRARARETTAQGREFGNSADNQTCVDETFARYKKEPGFFNAAYYGQFLNACLKASRPTPGFCDEVPAGKMDKLMTWRAAQCAHYDIPNDQKCQQLLSGEVMFCGPKQSESE